MSQQCLPDEYAVDPPLIHQVSKTQGADSQNVELKDTTWESTNYLMASQYLSWTLYLCNHLQYQNKCKK